MAQLKFVDTHAHIHFSDYKLDADQVWEESKIAGVTKMLAVGCDIQSSIRAVEFAKGREGVYAVIGVHPHFATEFMGSANPKQSLAELLKDIKNDKIVAIGEFGLDYFYENSSKTDQIDLLKLHLELCQEYNLPACFHIREAFDDFWPIFEQYHKNQKITGVMHSFTDTEANMKKGLDYGLYIALNGIMTFSRKEEQLAMAKSVPIGSLLLETDAPYLTPKQFRGKICKPEYVVLTAEFLADLRGEDLSEISINTTKNAETLFKI